MIHIQRKRVMAAGEMVMRKVVGIVVPEDWGIMFEV